jgi:RNA 3'-terminal phosphate cyclase (ATP)
MLVIDGSRGEGGGQVLRTALALALCLRRPFRIVDIRKNRARPGLAWQHLTAVRAAAAVGDAEVVGAQLHATELTFTPRGLLPGEHRFAIGTAGSTTLVLQTILPALLTAADPSRIVIDGGTHNPLAPSFDFIERSFLPVLRQMGAKVEARLVRHGFLPAGGGRIDVEVEPVAQLRPIELLARGAVIGMRARVYLAHLPWHIAEREAAILHRRLGLAQIDVDIVPIADAPGPGNAIVVDVVSEGITEVFAGIGERGVRAETVAGRLADEVERYRAADVPVGLHLADQLLLPVALAGSGVIRTVAPTLHTRTNAAVIEQFMAARFGWEAIGPQAWEIRLDRGAAPIV